MLGVKKISVFRLQIVVVCALILVVPAVLYFVIYYNGRVSEMEARYLGNLAVLSKQVSAEIRVHFEQVENFFDSTNFKAKDVDERRTRAHGQDGDDAKNTCETPCANSAPAIIRCGERFRMRYSVSFENEDICITYPIGKFIPSFEDDHHSGLHDATHGFDALLLVLSNGTIIHRRDLGAPTIVAGSIPELIPKLRPGEQGAPSGGIVRHMTISGGDYSVFFEPVTIGVILDEHADDDSSEASDTAAKPGGTAARPNVQTKELAPEKSPAKPRALSLRGSRGESTASGPGLYVVGLVSSQRLNNDALAVSPIAFVLLFVLLFLVLLSGPLLKIIFVAQHEKLHRAEVVLLFVGSGVVTFVVVLVGLVACAHFGFIALVDEDLKKLAVDAKHGLARDLGQTYDLLEPLAGKPQDRSKVQLTTDARKDFCAQRPCPEGLDSLAWSDTRGQQKLKLAAGPRALPALDVHRRDYFKEAKALELHDLPEVDEHDSTVRHGALEVIRCRITGKAFAVVAAPTCRGALMTEASSAGESCGKGACSAEDEHEACPDGVASAQVEIAAFTDTVAPLDFQLALIDENGRVLLHSELEHHREENLFEEIDSRALRAAIRAGHEETFTVRYMGTSTRLHALPLAQTGWTIITYAGFGMIDTLSVDIVLAGSVGLAAFMLFTALLIALAAALRISHRLQLPEGWWFPMSVSSARYGSLIAANLILGAWTLIFIILRPVVAPFVAAAAALCGVFVLICFSRNQRSSAAGDRADDRARVRARARACGFSVLFLFAAVPAAACFADAFHNAATDLVRAAQVGLFEELEEHPACLADAAQRAHGVDFGRGPCANVFGSTHLVDGDTLGTSDSGFSPPPALAGFSRWALDAILPIYSDTGVYYRDLHHGEGKVASWHGDGARGAFERAGLKVSTSIPGIFEVLPPTTYLSGIAIIFLTFLVFCWYFAGRCFDRLTPIVSNPFVGPPSPEELVSRIERGERLLLIDPPEKDLQILSAKLPAAAIDLTPAETDGTVDPSLCWRCEQLELALSDPAWAAAAHTAIGRTLEEHAGAILIAPTLPASLFSDWPADQGAEKARWLRMLQSFQRVEFGAESASVAYAREGKNCHDLEARLERIWSVASADEQLVMIHLAEEGLPNPNAALICTGLYARGILTSAPPAFFSPEFRKYILERADRARAERLASEQRGGIWSSVRAPILMGAAVILGFLTTSHAELATAGAVIPALSTALPLILRRMAAAPPEGSSSYKTDASR